MNVKGSSEMGEGLAPGAQLVLDLLEYIEQVEKLKTKPCFTVPTDFFVAHQHELSGLPGVQLNSQAEGDDVWLRMPRMQAISPPEPDDRLRPWIALGKNPDKPPELKSEAVAREGAAGVGHSQLKDHPEVQESFDWYLEFLWTPWATAERPRRQAIARYNQLFSLQQAISTEGAETPIELVWGIGYASWKNEGFSTAVKYPLLVQACGVSLNEETLDLEVRPRDVEPRLEVDCYAEMELPGVKQLEAYWRSALATGTNRVNPFEISTYDGTLKAAVGHLDPSGAYDVRAMDTPPPAPSERLTVTNTWVLFARRRSGDIFLEDVRRLKKRISEVAVLPAVIRSFVEPGDSAVRIRPEQAYRGLSTSESAPHAMELYFPMAYNDEQVSIIQKLHANDGVVVQGPPGTGKTHTIANVICHYLAQGKRVLVTSKGESALAVLRDKLPERVRPLSVALLSDERDGMKQFEHSIQTIASSVANLDPTRAARRIASAEERLNQLHAKIAHVDRTVAACAAQHMRHYSFGDRDVTPEELARTVLEQSAIHQWFDDEPAATDDGAPPFDDEVISGLRRLRMLVGADLAYLRHTLPAIEALPAWVDLLGLHRDRLRVQTIEASVHQGTVLPLVDSRKESFEKAAALGAFLDSRKTLRARLAGVRHPWVATLSKRVADMEPDDPALAALVEVCGDVRKLDRQRRELLAKAVEVPCDAELNEGLMGALDRLAQGKSAFALWFGNGDSRNLLAKVTVSGATPASPADWSKVQALVTWRVEARRVLARWSSLSGEFGLGDPPAGVEQAFRSVALWQACVEDARRLTVDFDSKLHSRLEGVFGKQNADRVREEGESFLEVAYASLQTHLEKNRLAFAEKQLQELIQLLEGHSGAVVERLRSFFQVSIGDISIDESLLQSTWVALGDELRRLAALRPALEQIEQLTDAVEAAGAVNWARRLRTEAATPDLDTVTPLAWKEAWHWRRAVMLLDSIDGHHRMRELFKERGTLTTELARTYQDLVAEKTWLGVFNNSPDSVRQALQAYLNAVQAMGSGTGVRAVRHRETARKAMHRAYKAVPCWVLPEWRISETPAEVGLFDLVIIDEASQSDIWALPALLRGQKVLVVGDHKQVSPSAIGTAEQRIKELVNRFLISQPHGSEMTPDKSIYDLARVVFAGNSVMLKEHFRCVPPIIEFSNREFYQGDIKPLRVPNSNERLDPPLVDVFVKGGNRRGDTNQPEAQAIVDEVEAILADRQCDGRSIGVVTLLGTEQAKLIHMLLTQRVSPVDIVERKIAIGPPPVFQGRERDIMLVSMVVSPGDRAAANRSDMQQRFNVALSRARDRMYLFRSVGDTEFREDSLNGRLISHFRQPFRHDLQKAQALRERCESGFELDMFDELVKRGYRVEPQVPSGGYRIDFVVEGREGRRLAVECDGDRFHGPGQWQDDMARQRVLERAGWTFWRCFASSFARRREAVMEDLVRTLNLLGIEPLGADSVDCTTWVHHKEVDPMGVDNGKVTS